MHVTVSSPDRLPSDVVLVRRIIDGDERAFRVLYERHTPRLKMLVHRLLGRRVLDTDDVLQETWLATCRSLHQYRGDAKLSTWLTAIAVRACYASLGRLRDDDEMMSYEDTVASPGDTPAGTIDLERALAELPDRQRLVVVLHDVEGFTHEEIGEQLGMAPGTSKATLSRARKALRQMLTTGVSNATR
jgi:RNA polymerase sigma-70 factor (ECF subfamily)